MTTRQRTGTERNADFARFVESYLRGSSLLEMTRTLSLSDRDMRRMLGKIQGSWTDQYLSDTEARKALELAKIDHLESAAWTGWDKSLEEAYAKEVQSDGTDKRAKSTFKNQTGDPQFLKQVAWCISMRCGLLGIDACSQQDATGSAKRMSQSEVLVQLQRYGMDSPQWSRRLQENLPPA